MPGAVLRVSGSKVGVKRFLAESRWQPTAIYWKGGNRLADSTLISQVNGFNVTVSDAEGSRLDRQIRDAMKFLKGQKADLKRLSRLRLHAVMDFGVHASHNEGWAFYRFDKTFLKALSQARIALEVSHYGGPADHDG